jgi:hypothetical protein
MYIAFWTKKTVLFPNNLLAYNWLAVVLPWPITGLEVLAEDKSHCTAFFNSGNKDISWQFWQWMALNKLSSVASSFWLTFLCVSFLNSSINLHQTRSALDWYEKSYNKYSSQYVLRKNLYSFQFFGGLHSNWFVAKNI